MDGMQCKQVVVLKYAIVASYLLFLAPVVD